MAPPSGITGTVSSRKQDNSPGNPLDNKGPKITPRGVLGYIFLPRVLPRLADLFLTGFGFFAFFMAQVYRGVRLLPEGHATLNPANIGQFNIRDVISEAARHLVWRRENIDQILVFIAILAGLVLLILQALTLFAALAMPAAMAQPSGAGFGAMFGAPAYPGGAGSTQDIAFILLDRVFGVPGIFNSCISTNTPCFGVTPDAMSFDKANTVYKPSAFPWPFHDGLHALFQFYSTGLLLVGVFILIYFVIVIVAETAQTGTPFGKRFNTVWAPLRLVMAFGLLIPISNGLNSAQYITLYAAKWGSNFATNGWFVFNSDMSNSAERMSQNQALAVQPHEPEANGLLQFMTLAHTCKVYEESYINMGDYSEAADLQASNPTNNLNTAAATPAKPASNKECNADTYKGRKIEAYIVKTGSSHKDSYRFLKDTSYADALKFAENNDITVRFGDMDCENGGGLAARVIPYCGEITLPTSSLTEPGAVSVQTGYYNLVQHLWGGYGNGEEIATYFGTAANTNLPKACTSEAQQIANSAGDKTLRTNALAYFQNGTTPGTGICDRYANGPYASNIQKVTSPSNDWMNKARDYYMWGGSEDDDGKVSSNGYNGGKDSVVIRTILKTAVADMRKDVEGTGSPYRLSPDSMARGWAAAGVWYNKIAEMNGSLIGAAWDIPTASRYPMIMMQVLQQKRQTNPRVSPADMFDPGRGASTSLKLPAGEAGRDYARDMNNVYGLWNAADTVVHPSTGNAFADLINYIFGTKGLFDLRSDANKDAHPLAQLVGVGRSLIEVTIRNLGIGLGLGIGGGLAALGGLGGIADMTGSLSGFFFGIASMTMTAGFLLFYVIPFLPFLYFFFAVGNWVKGIFEAMVGVPLWALAHLRIDGNGLPGEAAINGYFMIFEIFLRPILIIFGLLASVTIFAAMAGVLHEIFDIAVDNLTGAEGHSGAMGAIDKLFYTVMYAAIMYMIGMSSFKLIDLIPNQMMRWLGTNVSTFADMTGDPASQLTSQIAMGGTMAMNQITGGMQSAMGGLRSAGSAGNAALKAAGSKAANSG